MKRRKNLPGLRLLAILAAGAIAPSLYAQQVPPAPVDTAPAAVDIAPAAAPAMAPAVAPASEPAVAPVIVPAAIPAPVIPVAKHAEFGKEKPSRVARRVADWVLDSGDNKGRPYVVLDKVAARVYLFEADGRLRGAAAALLGIAIGDHSAPGVGDREMSTIPLKDRTTPAGRFEAGIGRNYSGKEILWVDYDAAISMHPVINTVPHERRPHRLATETPLDNRISFGCINVPIPFFKTIVSPAFTPAGGVVYVLPEVLPLDKVIATYDVDERAQMLANNPNVRAEPDLAQ